MFSVFFFHTESSYFHGFTVIWDTFYGRTRVERKKRGPGWTKRSLIKSRSDRRLIEFQRRRGITLPQKCNPKGARRYLLERRTRDAGERSHLHARALNNEVVIKWRTWPNDIPDRTTGNYAKSSFWSARLNTSPSWFYLLLRGYRSLSDTLYTHSWLVEHVQSVYVCACDISYGFERISRIRAKINVINRFQLSRSTAFRERSLVSARKLMSTLPICTSHLRSLFTRLCIGYKYTSRNRR